MKRRKKLALAMGTAAALVVAAASVLPFCYVLVKSLITSQGFSVRPYYRVFAASPQYLIRFWKSLFMCLCVAGGQLLVSVLAGFGFGKCRFPGREPLFFFLMILLMMPVQVTLVPNYIMINQLNLLNTYAALILPAIFMPLGTFILRQCFHAVPDSIIDAALLDGCGVNGVLWRVAVPMNVSGMVCVLILSFLDAWNMVEQPIAYLEDFSQYPLSVALAYAPPTDNSVLLACCVLAVLPPLALFTIFNKDLVEGITLGEVK